VKTLEKLLESFSEARINNLTDVQKSDWRMDLNLGTLIVKEQFNVLMLVNNKLIY